MKCASSKLFPRHPGVWFAAFAIWFGVLWWLSSGSRDIPFKEEISYADKICHFGYYFGGGILVCGGFLRTRRFAAWAVLLTILVVTLVGVSDEFHQSFVPSRSGNDPLDLTADFLGATCGALLMRALQRRLF